MGLVLLTAETPARILPTSSDMDSLDSLFILTEAEIISAEFLCQSPVPKNRFNKCLTLSLLGVKRRRDIGHSAERIYPELKSVVGKYMSKDIGGIHKEFTEI